ncbi:MAG: DUF2752 domain-containing protein [Planctomycetota bacterium]
MASARASSGLTDPAQTQASRRTSTLAERLGGFAVAVACLAVLLIAAGLSAAPEGHGTHTQLGLPACGWATALGGPCPTCGMTTSFTCFADNRPAEAFATQPFGATLALVVAAGFWGGCWTLLTGDRIGTIFLRLLRPPLLWTSAVAAGAAWAYKALTW